MINVDLILSLSEIMAKVLFYGFSNSFSFDVIENGLSNSEFFSRLEKGDDSFYNNALIIDYLKDVYKDEKNLALIVGTNVISEWIAEAYIRLFFKFHKSISYILIYMPLEDMTYYFNVYHEMDWTQLYDLFVKKTSEKTLLNKLLEKRNISKHKLSALTGIKESTIKYYSLSDKNLYSANIQNVFSLCRILDVNINIMVENTFNYLNTDIYDDDKYDVEYRSLLALNIINYFKSSIKIEDYVFDDTKKMLTSKSGDILKVLFTKSAERFSPEWGSSDKYEIDELLDEAAKEIPMAKRNKCALMIFVYNGTFLSASEYNKIISKYNFNEVYVICDEEIAIIRKDGYRRVSALLSNTYNLLADNAKKSLFL